MTEFRSRWGVYLTRVQINGNTRTIRFAELRDGESYYATSKWEEVEALKNHIGYMTDFYLFKEDPTVAPPVEKKAAPKGKDVAPVVAKEPEKVAKVESIPEPEPVDAGKDVAESVVNISQAREYLIKKGVIIQKLRTPKSILKYAAEMGVVFPNLKAE